jgi:DNA-binding transcriptional regulator YiaG
MARTVAYPHPMERFAEAVEVARIREKARSGKAKAIREQAGVSRAEIARSIRVHPGTIGRWEEGLRSPRGAAARRYGAVLKRLSKLAP